MSENLYSKDAVETANYHRAVLDTKDGLVLKNKLGITNPVELDKTEDAFTKIKALEGFPKDAHFKSFEGLCNIHKHLFSELYEWAGKPRDYTTGRSPAASFARPEFIVSESQKLFKGFAREKFFKGLPKDKFVQKIAEGVNELNAIHPFIDGNGRTQRVWLKQISENAGFKLKFKSEDKDRYNDAAKTGFQEIDYRPMARLISERLEPIERTKVSRKTRDDSLLFAPDKDNDRSR